MKIHIKNYSFDKLLKQVTFLDYDIIRLDSIYLITNVTSNVILYNFATNLLGGTVAGNVLTLNYNTNSMSNTDDLMIFYEDDRKEPDASEIGKAIDEETNWLLRRVVKLLESNAVVDLNMRQKVVVEGAIISSGTVTTVGTVNNIAAIAGIDPRFQFIEYARTSYNSGVRNNLIFS